MTFLNNNSLPDEKLDLKPSELTIANLLENNFNLSYFYYFRIYFYEMIHAIWKEEIKD